MCYVHDWHNKLALIFHPVRSKTKTNVDSRSGTHYVLRGDEYDLHVQDASPATTGQASLKKRARRQRGGMYPGARANNPSPSRIAQMEQALRARYRTNPQRQRAAPRALANRPTERLARGVNRALWSVHRRLTPTTLTSKLSTAAATPLALLSSVLALVIKKKG